MHERRFWIGWYHRGVRNLFQTTARGEFSPEGQGTRIQVSVGVELAVLMFTLIIVGGVSFAAVSNNMFGESALAGMTIPLIALLMYVIGRWVSRNDATRMLDLIRSELSSRNPYG